MVLKVLPINQAGKFLAMRRLPTLNNIHEGDIIMILFKKFIFRILLLLIIDSTLASDQLREENFEEFRNQGMHDFLNSFGSKKSLEIEESFNYRLTSNGNSDKQFEDPFKNLRQQAEFKNKEEVDSRMIDLEEFIQGFESQLTDGSKMKEDRKHTEEANFCFIPINGRHGVHAEAVVKERMLDQALKEWDTMLDRIAQGRGAYDWIPGMRLTRWMMAGNEEADFVQEVERVAEKVCGLMVSYKCISGKQHPRWDEFSGKN